MAGRFTTQGTDIQAGPPPIADEREGTLPSTSTRSSASSDSSSDGGSFSTGDGSDRFGEPETQRAPIRIRWGVADTRGGRPTMEDAHVAIPDINLYYDQEFEENKRLSFFGVFDGHGGSGAAKFIQDHLLDMLVAQPSFPGRPGEALTEAFLRTDEMLYDLVVRKRAQEDSGSTALAALVAGGDLIVANAGDCRAILCRRGRLIELSRDHKASSIHESTRIRAAGGRVDCEGYLNANLSVGRALGDFFMDGMKAMCDDGRLAGPLTANPEVFTHTLMPDDEFMVVACDGLWDVVSSPRVIELARCFLRDDNDPGRCAKFLVEHSRNLKTTDNVTIIVVCFSEQSPPVRANPAGFHRVISQNGLNRVNSALMESTEGGLQRAQSSSSPLQGSRHASPMVSRPGSESPTGESSTTSTRPPLPPSK